MQYRSRQFLASKLGVTDGETFWGALLLSLIKLLRITAIHWFVKFSYKSFRAIKGEHDIDETIVQSSLSACFGLLVSGGRLWGKDLIHYKAVK
jgi:hypothetical protein